MAVASCCGSRSPVPSCYDSGKAAVCLEIPGDNRRNFFRTKGFAARRQRRLAGTDIRRARKPVPRGQAIESARDFGTKIFREKSCAGSESREQPANYRNGQTFDCNSFPATLLYVLELHDAKFADGYAKGSRPH
jgi:hypothetical protein